MSDVATATSRFSRAVSDLGLHRVVSPVGALPQAADVLDPSLPIADNEILLDVHTLNIDSASFSQIKREVGANEEAVAAQIVRIVAARGKMQNPVTGSGGMLLGTVRALGAAFPARPGLVVGARVATLVSLTLTPLLLSHVHRVHLGADQVEVEGHAILWPTSPLTVVPTDMPEALALSVLDVCGAPAQVARLAKPGDRVAILGAGKSGVLCMAQARRTLGETGRIVAVDRVDRTMSGALSAGLIDAWATVDAKDPVQTAETIRALLGGPADLVINTANVEATEMSAILAVADTGTVYFFNMATSFARAALGAEGVGSDARLLIGNGYAPGHAEMALDLLRQVPFVRHVFAAQQPAAVAP